MKNKSLPRDKRKNKKELVASVGYSTKVAGHKQKEIIEAKGVKDALANYGLTEELVTTALVFDIKGKPKRRVKELSLGAEILGMKKQGEGNKTLILVVSGETAQRYGVVDNSIVEGGIIEK